MSQMQDVADLSAMDRAAPDDDGEARKALWGSALGYAMDGFDLLILGFMLRAISADLHLTATQAASLVTATLVGAVIGGFLFGMLSDHLGRVRVLTWTIVLFAVFTGLCALAQGYWDLLAYRTVAGIGLGGEFGIGMALVAEAWPAAKRARVSSYVGLGWQSGVLAAALVTPLLLPVIGWRGMFLIGIFPAISAYFIRFRLHEPEVFIANKAQNAASAFSLRRLVADTETTKTSLGMIVLCSVQNFGYYGIMIWLPNYLSTQFGYGLTQSALWTAVTIAGMALGIFVFGDVADRFGRRPAFLSYMLGAAVMVVVYSRLVDPGALMSELYPTSARATAQNVFFNIGRAVAGFGPLAVGALSASYGFSTAIALLALLYLVDIAALLLLVPERRGAELA
jgi:MFS family permease